MERIYKKCRVCGGIWNVSRYNTVPEAEYVCTACQGRKDKSEYKAEWRKKFVKGERTK